MSDWKPWTADGKTFEGPLPYYQYCEIKMADGEIWGDEPAGVYNWGCKDEPGEIIAYRVPEHLIIAMEEREYA